MSRSVFQHHGPSRWPRKAPECNDRPTLRPTCHRITPAAAAGAAAVAAAAASTDTTGFFLLSRTRKSRRTHVCHAMDDRKEGASERDTHSAQGPQMPAACGGGGGGGGPPRPPLPSSPRYGRVGSNTLAYLEKSVYNPRRRPPGAYRTHFLLFTTRL